MKKIMGIVLVCFIVGQSCEAVRKVEFNELLDLNPPEIISIKTISNTEVEFCFNEVVNVVENSILLDHALQLAALTFIDCGFIIVVNSSMHIGEDYTISITVADANKNTLEILTTVYGYNDTIPTVVINEFTTRGSKTHPDLVELYVITAGNIGGLTLYEGTPLDWESRKILPNLDVTADSYLLVHFKPQGIAVEVDEVSYTSESDGLDVHPSAWDFWVADGNGLSGNNGALTLTDAPDGAVIDAALYTNRTSASDTKYRGFGSTATLLRAEEIVDYHQWKIVEALVRPEDCIFIDKSTATRSISRNSLSEDTDANQDWHIVPTSQYSFGTANSDEVYGE